MAAQHPALNQQLLRDVRAILGANPQTRDWHCVLALPCGRRGADSLASLLGAKAPDKRRVVALAIRPVEHSEATGGGPIPWKAVLYILKAEAVAGGDTKGRSGRSGVSTLVVTDTLKLKALARLEGGAADADGKCREVVLVLEGALGRHKETFTCDDTLTRGLLLGALWHVSIEAAHASTPQLSGLATSDVRSWAASAKKTLRLPTQRTGFLEDGDGEYEYDDEEDEDDGGRTSSAGNISGASGGQQSARLITEEEAEELQHLLDSYRLDVGDANVLEERLRKEAAALEASNVHALLEAEADLAAVMKLLRCSKGDVDDLAQWLDVFNVKLVHMRADIAAIERRNNRLSKRARNNSAVAVPLERLVEALTLPAGLDRALAGPLAPAAEARAAVRGARDLRAAMDALSAEKLDFPAGAFDAMRCVREHRATLARLRTEFVQRASTHVQRSGADIINSASSKPRSPDTVSAMPRAPDLTPARRALRDMQPLIAAVASLDSAAALVMRDAHVTALGAGMRRACQDLVVVAKQVVKDGANGGDTGLATVTSGGPNPGRAFCTVCADIVGTALDEVQFLAELHAREPGAASDHEDEEDGTDDHDVAAWAGPALLAIASELGTACEWVAKSDPPALVAVIGALGRAATTCTDRAQQCGSADLGAALAEVQARARSSFARFFEEKASQLSKSLDANSSSLTAFFTGVRVHELLPDVAKTLPLLQRLQRFAAETITRTPPPRGGAPLPSDGRREAADAAYGRLLPALLSYIDRAAAGDKDHMSEVRLRSYSAVADALSPLVRDTGGGKSSKGDADAAPELSDQVHAAREAVDSALAAYTDDMLARSLPVPLDILARIESTLATGMAPDAVAFQAGLARTDVRRILKDALGNRKVEKAVQEVYARVAKHFRGGPGSGAAAQPALFDTAWHSVCETLLDKWGRLEEYMHRLYGDALAPSAAEMEDLLLNVEG